MKTKAPVSTKKQAITVKDLKTSKDPKGGVSLNFAKIEIDYVKASPSQGSQGYLK
jgi:hypothetical protein